MAPRARVTSKVSCDAEEEKQQRLRNLKTQKGVDLSYKSTTIMAHNMKACDGSFILELCQRRSFIPDNIIRSGSKVQQMYFKSGNARFIDTLNLFIESLRKLSGSSKTDTFKKVIFLIK